VKIIHITLIGYLLLNSLNAQDIYGCTDPEALNYNPLATIDDGTCLYLTAPQNLNATGGDLEIELNWDSILPQSNRSDVVVWISDITQEYVDISISISEDLYGIQFHIIGDAALEIELTGFSGGFAEEYFDALYTNSYNMVYGFSMTGNYIPAGTSGLLVRVNWNINYVDDACATLDITGFAGIGGTALSYDIGEPYCIDQYPFTILYNVYRDNELYIENLLQTFYTDSNLGYDENHCYSITATDGENESNNSEIECASTNPSFVMSDSLTLVTIYNSTNGNQWEDNSGWLTEEPFCSWFRVTCENERVVAINLGGNELSGEIPLEIGNLTELTSLRLSYNDIGGTIPVSIGNLDLLEILDLSYNYIGGNIPSEIGNLVNLEYFESAVNDHIGEIPPEIGQLTNLTLLELWNNEMTGPLPSELGDLVALERLWLTGNNFSGEIPVSLGNLSNLTMLRLSANQLTGQIPNELMNLSNLEELRLTNNNLTGPIPDNIGDLTSLNRLHLHLNQLSGELPASIVYLSNLERLKLRDNNLSGLIPTDICDLNLYMGPFSIYNNNFCPPYPLCIRDYVGEQNISDCENPPSPDNLQVIESENELILSWEISESGPILRDEVMLNISYVTEDYIQISINNTVAISTFQFTIVADDPIDASYGIAYGGILSQVDYAVTVGSNSGLVSGVPFMDDIIPISEGVFTNIEWSQISSQNGNLNITDVIFLDSDGLQCSVQIGDPFYYDPQGIPFTYNIYRDGEQFITGLDETLFADVGMGYEEGHCYYVTSFDTQFESDYSNEACGQTFPEFFPGDVNFDNFVDVIDILLFVDVILYNITWSEEQIALGDLYVDGIIDIRDIVLLIIIILEN
jgi:Leucine-rich repeat (LRR) protein